METKTDQTEMRKRQIHNIPLSRTDATRQKIIKYIEELNNTINQQDLINIIE